jgi:AAA family ATP:ADP antiporter
VIFDVLFHALPQHGLALGVAFFIWVGCFNLMIVAQFWTFANDLYSRERGERLFALVAAGSAGGAVAGARLAKPLYRWLGPFPLLLVAAALLIGCVIFIWLVDRRQERASGKADPPVTSAAGVFALLFSDRYLLLVAALSVVKNWVNTTGEYILDRRLLFTVRHALAPGLDASTFIAGFKSDYFTYVNLAAMILQLVAVSRIIGRLGVGRALLVSPLVALVGYSSSALIPLLSVIFATKISENTLDYSLQKTAEQTLFLVTPRAAKYKVKPLIDTSLVRGGDVLSALLVWTGTRLAFSTSRFILANLALIGVWLAVVLRLGRAHRLRVG